MEQRAQFEVPDGVYLMSHSVGCLPYAARQASESFLGEWAENGGEAWPQWMQHIERFKSALAQLFNADAQEFCPQLNLSSGLSKLISALPKRTGRTKLICSELDFPTIGFVMQASAAALGYELELIPAGDGTLPAERWIEHLTPDVQLAHVTYSFSENSYCTDIPEIMRAAHQRSIFVVIDVAQSAGVLPIDLSKWDAVAVIGSCVKWLCGGPGAGWLWVRNDLATELSPVDVGWWSHAEPFEFDIRHFQYAPDARRFMGGTPSPLPYAVATKGLETINAIGVDRIRAHNLMLLGKLREAAVELGLTVNTPQSPKQCGGTLVLDWKDRKGLHAALAAEGIRVDARPRFGLRFSPHIYNRLLEVEFVADVLRKAVVSAPASALSSTAVAKAD